MNAVLIKGDYGTCTCAKGSAKVITCPRLSSGGEWRLTVLSVVAYLPPFAGNLLEFKG